MNMENQNRPLAYRRCEEIIGELENRGFSAEVPKRIVEEAIITVVGASRSTIIQYFKALCIYKFLDLVAPGVYRIIGAEPKPTPAELEKDKPIGSVDDVEAQLEAMRQAEADIQRAQEGKAKADAQAEAEQEG